MSAIINGFPANYRTPSNVGTVYELLNTTFSSGLLTQISGNVKIYNNDILVDTFTIESDGTVSGYFTINNGNNKIVYTVTESIVSETPEYNTYTASFTIVGITNRYPLKPWTIEDVITRTLQLVEPLREGETPRFSFDKSKEKYPELFDALAPEFTFTRMNLRESMQTVGGYIHAEPRLVADEDGNGNESYRITFDFYGENEYAVYKNYKTQKENRLNLYKYTTSNGSYGIEQACTKLDSYMDNLVNRLDWESATVGQPIGETAGAQTLRTETAYTQEKESDGYYFPTVYAIDKIVKMEYIHTNEDKTTTPYDITPYLFESTVYNTLSSFDRVYPTSKSYALNFTYGQKGVKGFFYKVPNVTSGVGDNYSIINVINAAMGTNYNINDLGGSSFYNGMKFRLTYVPIYSTRIQHGKQYLDDYLPLPRVMNYSQSDNSVETRFYGEHIKGAAQRMGNVEKNVTFIMRNVKNAPNAGDLWDDEYYISSVSVAVKQDHFEITCGLSKNFNRKSKYIGASTYKRIYEVSEVMVQERHTVYTDYLVLTDYVEDQANFYSDDETLISSTAIKTICLMFSGYTEDNSISTAYAYGQTKKANENEKLTEVMLPVVASAFGNVMEFTWQYKDNFSAGLKILPQDPNDAITYFGQEVQYSDYYGRMYYYTFRLLTGKETQKNPYIQEDTENSYPQVSTNANNGDEPSIIGKKYIERKDSREALKKSYALEIVANDSSFVVGSAFASKNPLVSFIPTKYDNLYQPVNTPHLYILKTRINKFSSYIDDMAVDLGAINISDTRYLSYAGKSNADDDNVFVSGKAWAYAYPIEEGEKVKVENEDGELTEISKQKGGEILFGKNIDIPDQETTVGAFTFIPVHDIFKYIQAKNNK